MSLQTFVLKYYFSILYAIPISRPGKAPMFLATTPPLAVAVIHQLFFALYKNFKPGEMYSAYGLYNCVSSNYWGELTTLASVFIAPSKLNAT